MVKLTTVIPVYNGARFLWPTLMSVARQTRSTDRLIILDNCSTDETEMLVRKFQSEFPCEWHRNEKNLGLFGNMNRALGFSDETDYLHILTADDLILPTFYEQTIAACQQFSGVALGFARFSLIDGDGNPLPPWWYIDYKDNGGSARQHDLSPFLRRQREMQTVLLPAAIYKTNRRAIPMRFCADFPMHADSVFLAEWAWHARNVVEVPYVLAHYRIHTQNETRRLEQQLATIVDQEWAAMERIFALETRPVFSGWLEKQRLKCLFSARLHVTIQRLGKVTPEISNHIKQRLPQTIMPLHWSLGGIAVRLRDALQKFRKS